MLGLSRNGFEQVISNRRSTFSWMEKCRGMKEGSEEQKFVKFNVRPEKLVRHKASPPFASI
jgi:hypothetical protein